MMSKEAKERLKLIPRSTCSKCGSKRDYTNPVWKCYECKKKFCFSDLWGGQVKKGMAKNEEIRDICDDCRNKHGYFTLGS